MTGSCSRRAARGFTLIELLVVMLIIGTLLSIAVPRYFRTLAHARETVLRQDLAILREAIDKYYADRGEYPDTLVALADKRYVQSIPLDPRSEEHTSELQSRQYLVCRLLLEKKKKKNTTYSNTIKIRNR